MLQLGFFQPALLFLTFENPGGKQTKLPRFCPTVSSTWNGAQIHLLQMRTWCVERYPGSEVITGFAQQLLYDPQLTLKVVLTLGGMRRGCTQTMAHQASGSTKKEESSWRVLVRPMHNIPLHHPRFSGGKQTLLVNVRSESAFVQYRNQPRWFLFAQSITVGFFSSKASQARGDFCLKHHRLNTNTNNTMHFICSNPTRLVFTRCITRSAPDTSDRSLPVFSRRGPKVLLASSRRFASPPPTNTEKGESISSLRSSRDAHMILIFWPSMIGGRKSIM